MDDDPKRRGASPTYTDETRETVIERLSEGESLASICRDAEMPCYRTIQLWAEADKNFASEIMRAREIGYMHRADKAVADAKVAEDAAKGRLALDAERWYLGKLSNAFSDNKAHRHELTGKDGGAVAIKREGPDLTKLSADELRAMEVLLLKCGGENDASGAIGD